MAIYNKRYEMKTKAAPEELLDEVLFFLRTKMRGKEYPLRFAITDVKQGKVILDVTILDMVGIR